MSSYNQKSSICAHTFVITCVDDKLVLSVQMFINRTIITVDILQDIVLSHTVWIHFSYWSLTADSHRLGCHGKIFQDKEQLEKCQGCKCQNNQQLKDYEERSQNTSSKSNGFLSQIHAIFLMFAPDVIFSCVFNEMK